MSDPEVDKINEKKLKAKGDWCKDHDRADSQCFVCHPELEAKFAARYEAKVGSRNDLKPLALRVTSIFGRETDGWKLVHRHADPITTVQPPESVLPM